MACSGRMPSTLWAGPVMPRSVTKPNPLGSTWQSAVGTWVWVPQTAWARPSRYQPMAPFSLVASAWKSTSTSAWKSTSTTSVPSMRLSTRSAVVKGFSKLLSISHRPMRLITPMRTPFGPSYTPQPRPGTRLV